MIKPVEGYEGVSPDALCTQFEPQSAHHPTNSSPTSQPTTHTDTLPTTTTHHHPHHTPQVDHLQFENAIFKICPAFNYRDRREYKQYIRQHQQLNRSASKQSMRMSR